MLTVFQALASDGSVSFYASGWCLQCLSLLPCLILLVWIYRLTFPWKASHGEGSTCNGHDATEAGHNHHKGGKGYEHNDTIAELSRLMKLRNLPGPLQRHRGESIEDCAARFLKARGGSIDKALNFLEEDAAWRHRKDIRRLAAINDPWEVLQGDAALLQKYQPHLAHGHDKQGHPVIYKSFGHMTVMEELVQHMSLERIDEYNAWLNERWVELLAERSSAEKKCVTQWCIVIDATGFCLSLLDAVTMQWVKQMAETDKNHYPERLARVIIVNSPRVLALGWRLIRKFVDPATQDKVQILGGENEWKPVLSKFIDESQLIAKYGGLAEAPTTAEGRAQALLRSAKSSSELAHKVHPQSAQNPGQTGAKDLRSFQKSRQSRCCGSCMPFCT